LRISPLAKYLGLAYQYCGGIYPISPTSRRFGKSAKYWIDYGIRKMEIETSDYRCTLNSCVRVSSIETVDHIKNRNLRVVVDLSICGARSGSFLPSSLYAGESAVESAIRQMTAAGVQVAGRVEWR
jgi:hypothetical protein